MSTPNVRALKSAGINRPVGYSSHAWTVSGPGRWIHTSGYTSRDETGAVVHVGDLRGQTRLTFENIRRILAEDNASFEHVVKIVCYVVDRKDYDIVCEERIRVFPKNPPAVTAVVVNGLIDPDVLIEIEAVAFVPEAR